jgi:DNA-binding response OmpR family regulator
MRPHDPYPRIVVVEDEPIVALDLEDRLRQLGYEVCGVATRADDAVEAIAGADPDVVLLDVNLGPGASGLVVAEQIRACSDAAFIFLTGFRTGSSSPGQPGPIRPHFS